jgi:hypothetical protein
VRQPPPDVRNHRALPSARRDVRRKLDGFLLSPSLFRRYFMPVFEEQGRILHAQGKLMAVHMDGRLNSLKHLIAETPIDIVEALHPPPMGDVPLGEALRVWPDKVIWVGFPLRCTIKGRALPAPMPANCCARRRRSAAGTIGHRHVHRKPGLE